MELKPTIAELFTTPLYQVKLGLDNKNLIKFCSAYSKNNKGRKISNVGGYQSHDLSLELPVIKDLIKKIEEHATNFAKVLINDNKQIVDNMWININKYKDSNNVHCHPGTDISGVYYIKTPENCGNIVFDHPMKQGLSFANVRYKIKDYNSYNSLEWEFTPVPDVLYLFPAWVNHHVEPNENKTKERLSISFNTYEN